MDIKKRIFLAAGILLVDLIIFFLPLTALFLIYILLFNPPWFRDFLNNLDVPPGKGSRRGDSASESSKPENGIETSH